MFELMMFMDQYTKAVEASKNVTISVGNNPSALLTAPIVWVCVIMIIMIMAAVYVSSVKNETKEEKE